jgi:hypothetical protein
MRVKSCERVQAGTREPHVVDWAARPSCVWISPFVSTCLRRYVGLQAPKGSRGSEGAVGGSVVRRRIQPRMNGAGNAPDGVYDAEIAGGGKHARAE